MTEISENNKVRNEILLNLVFQAARDAIEKIKSINFKEGYAVSRHTGWVIVSYDENGLPNFREAGFMNGERDFSSFVSYGNLGKIKVEQIDSYVALGNYGITDQEFRKAVLPNRDNSNDNSFRYIAHSLANSIVERYMHMFSDQEFTLGLCKNLYIPLERKIYLQNLQIEIIVPIILLDFELDEIQLTDNAYIIKMTNNMQMGRAQTTFSGDGINKGALSGCTHALVLKNWSIYNEHYWSNASAAQSPDIMDRIERFFASIRIVRNVETGYAQLVQYAVDWATEYVVDLPEMSFEFTRAYPPSLEKGYLGNLTRPIISQSEMQEIAKIYSFLMLNEHASLTIAVKRINTCYLRSSEEDSIIDATIAMEALFGDNETQEMTHKLALRMAALSSLDVRHERSVLDIFTDTKQIYTFRSKVVHGRKGKEVDKARFITNKTGKISVLEVALTNLRQAIRVFAENPKFLDPLLIDKTLLLHTETISPNNEL